MKPRGGPSDRLRRSEGGINDGHGCRHAGRMVDRLANHGGLHALSHERLRLLDDHPVVFRQQVPARNVLPPRTSHGGADARHGDRTLHHRQPFLQFPRRVLGKRGTEGFVRQPDQATRVRSQLRRQRMRLRAVEHVGHDFTFIGRKGSTHRDVWTAHAFVRWRSKARKSLEPTRFASTMHYGSYEIRQFRRF